MDAHSDGDTSLQAAVNDSTSMNNSNVPPLTWQPTDASSLAPTNLPVAKAQRAWERKPQSPFSRAKVRFGKVWKRATNSSQPTTGLFSNAKFELVGGVDSPVKAVKKMRMAGGEELVSNWEGRGSPKNRRIVTRSNRENEDLVALVEGEETSEEAGEDVLKLEVVNEDGTVDEIVDEEELAQQGWEDDEEDGSMTEEDPHAWDSTLMHLAELREQQDAEGVQLSTDDSETSAEAQDQTDNTAASKQLKDEEDAAIDEHVASLSQVSGGNGKQDELPAEESAEASVDEASSQQSLNQPPVLPAAQPGPIPEGFVSPVKERRRRPIREVKQANANRRRTLPVNFAAQVASSLAASRTPAVVEAETATEPVPQNAEPEIQQRDEQDALASTEDITMDDQPQEPLPTDNEANDDEWEDMEEEEQNEPPTRQYAITPELGPGEEWIPTVENTPESSPEACLQINPDITRLAEEQMAAQDRLPASPVGSVSGQHPRLPLRRSPRRQSSSPLKRSIKPALDKPHLVAFTPIKLRNSGLFGDDGSGKSPQLPSSPDLLQKTDVEESNLTRSSSAPPEEPQMSPRKPPQPRMSDDTATLQAFLDRAAESKSGRRLSETAQRESLENRRDSDTVRQALASPAPAPVEVLADLDPNSPSPRKQVSTLPELIFVTDQRPVQNDDVDELAVSPPTRKSSRRSGRGKSKGQVLPDTTYTGPTKISVRGAGDGFVLKKTEAQELAQKTRTNTRKNKGTSVLPKLRLTRMANEQLGKEAEGAADGAMEIDKPTKIQWAETLESFYAGDVEPEVSMVTEELNGPEPENADDDTTQLNFDEQVQASMPPPSETPSKPKIRRLKLARTASTPGKSASQNEGEVGQVGESTEGKSEQSSEPKPKQKRRQLRMATPAKPKEVGGLSFLSDDVVAKAEDAAKKSSIPAPASAPASATAPAQSVTKKKVVSRLPAPASVSVGKENSLIASPPKKRTRATPAAAAKTSSISKSVPKLDFAAKQAEAASGITSPAKKAPKAQSLVNEAPLRPQELPPSLGSPAKKRTRRAVG